MSAAWEDSLRSRLSTADALVTDPGAAPHGPEEPRDWVPAAVLVLLQGASRAQLSALFTRRGPSLPVHAGQVSFPGGRIEAHDRDAVAAALRESHEEIGLPPERVRVLGLLNPFHTGTGFRIMPVVGWVPEPLDLAPRNDEVAEVFSVPLPHLLDPQQLQWTTRNWQGRSVQTYQVRYQSYEIWGATAAIVADLAQRMRDLPL